MNSELFTILNTVTAVKLLLGANPLRVYPWGRAPENPTKPYAVYGVYNANPENYLADRADLDDKGTQIDIFADTAVSIENCFNAIRNALETVHYGYLTSWSTPDLDEETNLYHIRMDYDFKDER